METFSPKTQLHEKHYFCVHALVIMSFFMKKEIYRTYKFFCQAANQWKKEAFLSNFDQISQLLVEKQS